MLGDLALLGDWFDGGCVFGGDHFAEFGRGDVGQIAAGDLPFLVGLDDHRGGQPQERLGLGKISTTSARRLISLLSRSIGLFAQIFCQCAFGNAVNANTSVLASAIMVASFGNDDSRGVAT